MTRTRCLAVALCGVALIVALALTQVPSRAAPAPWTWIPQNAVFARVADFDGTVLEEIRAPEAGVVLDVIVARAVRAEGFVGKIGVV